MYSSSITLSDLQKPRNWKGPYSPTIPAPWGTNEELRLRNPNHLLKVPQVGSNNKLRSQPSFTHKHCTPTSGQELGSKVFLESQGFNEHEQVSR